MKRNVWTTTGEICVETKRKSDSFVIAGGRRTHEFIEVETKTNGSVSVKETHVREVPLLNSLD